MATRWHLPTPCLDEAINTMAKAEFPLFFLPRRAHALQDADWRLDRAINQSNKNPDADETMLTRRRIAMDALGRRGGRARGCQFVLNCYAALLRIGRAPTQNAPSHGSSRLGSSAKAISQGSVHTYLSRGGRRDTCTALFAMTCLGRQSRSAAGTTPHLSHTDLAGAALGVPSHYRALRKQCFSTKSHRE